MALTGLFFLLSGGAVLLALRGARVVLWEDAIEFAAWGRRRRFQKGEIAGWREIPLTARLRFLVLEFRMGRKPIWLVWWWKEDEVFTAWLESLSSLDAEERGRIEAEQLGAPELGGSEAERRATLRTAGIVARIATVMTLACVAWGVWLPRPYGLVMGVLMAMPVAGAVLMAIGRGVYSLEGKRSDPRPSLLVPVIGPGLVLGVRAVFDLRTIDWQAPLLWTLPGALAATLALRACDPRALRRWYLVPLFAVVLAPWAWGSLTLGNAAFDRSSGETFTARVLEKSISSGSRTSYLLKLAPWGPMSEEHEVIVGRKAHQRSEVGDLACPRLRPGALGFRWFRVESCEGR